MATPATLEPKSGQTASDQASQKNKGTKPAAGEPCPKCGSVDPWGAASWCPKCGFYPRLESFGGASAGGAAAPSWQAEGHRAPSSHWDALSQLPAWAYVLAGGVLAIFGISVFVRVVTPDDSFQRSAWSVSQLVIGGLTFVGIHCYAFIRASMKGDGHSFWDAIIHPIEVWRPTFRELPATEKRVWGGLWGFTAAVCAVAIIGGIDYGVLTRDWGFKERPKQNLMQKIKDQMLANARDAENAAEDMDKAVKDFAGGDDALKNAKDKKQADLDMLTAECIVVGFNINKETGKVSELLLASIVDGNLAYVGSVREGFSGDTLEKLNERLPTLEQKTPLVKCNYPAIWVKPVITCRASFSAWTENKLMRRPAFKELMAEVDAK